MESAFGHDFGRVRIHTDERSGAAARAVHARAYSVGENIVFGQGHYAPRTTGGARLLAHELTHVVQQRRGAAAGQADRDASEDDHAERGARSVADHLITGARTVAPEVRAAPRSVQRARFEGLRAAGCAGRVAHRYL
jgi:hypothetical protein